MRLRTGFPARMLGTESTTSPGCSSPRLRWMRRRPYNQLGEVYAARKENIDRCNVGRESVAGELVFLAGCGIRQLGDEFVG
jgi:hypothetical protein